MVSQVRMATRAPGSWQEREMVRGERAGGKEWSPCSLLSLSALGTLRLWGEARREPVLSALLLSFWVSSTGGVQA